MMVERRHHERTGWQQCRTFYRDGIRDVYFALGLLDEKGNVSNTRVIAYLAAWAAVHARLFHDQPLVWVDFAILTLACFASLGKAGMEMYKELKQGPPTEKPEGDTHG